MPNWCVNTIQIKDEQEVLENLKSLIVEWTKKNYCSNGFGLNWLGNIVGNSGVDDMSTGDFTVACRGTLDDMELSDNTLGISTSTAWGPANKMWLKVLEKYAPNAEYIYESIEEANEVYQTNDETMKGLYIFDAFDCEEESDWDCTKDGVIKKLQHLLSTDEEDIETLLNRAFDELDNVSVHKWDFIPATETE